jgi:nitric oxide reductase
MVAKFFTQEHISSLKPLINKTINSVLEKMVAKGGDKPIDLVEHFSLPIPSLVGHVVP